MKTKEEILKEYGCPDVPFDENVTMFYPAILEAMEDYLQQNIPVVVKSVCKNCNSEVEPIPLGYMCPNCACDM